MKQGAGDARAKGNGVARCTRGRRWEPGRCGEGWRVVHVDARMIHSDDQSDSFECPNCGLRYEQVGGAGFAG